MKPFKFGILKNEDADSHLTWENACKKYSYEYIIIDLTSDTWLEEIKKTDCHCFLLRPPGRIQSYKTMYDEKIYIINKVLGKPVYPKFDEVILHENKKYLSYWLKAKNIPHIESHVFYNKLEALEFIKHFSYPIVGKTSIGSSGEGVVFLRKLGDAEAYIKTAFSSGVKRKAGPSARQGRVFKRLVNRILNPAETLHKFKNYYKVFQEVQIGFVVLQKYTPHEYEWRTAKIGDSYFGHKKIKVGEMCSGSKGIEYVNPPEKIMDFTRQVCEKGNFNCMAIDILEGENGEYLVNELQTIFGHVQDHILEIDGKPGRYIYKNKWIFEAGLFNSNLSFDLRLQNAVELLEKNLL